ncbi:MAG TPA: penicillin-binding transpeptidase domain-containing protein [Solirubrobacteraceae bacterium]|nr:penicillin-binding transpeptidase domain-containing protein [Solirubrobacteraceae bacterium]
MNQPIVRLFGLVVLMFALLLAFTSRWTIFEAGSLRDNPLNARSLLEQQRIDRGEILAANGKVMARSVRSAATRSSEATYTRRYPTGEEFAHAVGYYYIDLGRTGLESSRNSTLSGQSGTNLQSILDQLQGKRKQGDNVYTTLDPGAQQVANSALQGHEGAVVALEPRTGAVKVMASSPSYDPNALRSTRSYQRLARTAPGKPLVNRATQFGYAPGSTFKVVTATAAIDSGEFTPESTVPGRNDIRVSGVPLQNDENESFGAIPLIQAMAKSVNTVWAQVAERVGKGTMARYMRRFGFDRKPLLDYPETEMSTSGEYSRGRVISPRSPQVDVGRMGIGQDKLEVTPLQMAEVAAAVANDGRLMRPHLTSRVVDPDGRTVQRISPHVQSVVMKPSTADAVRQMMEAVVNEGTGTTAQIPGVQVAGKTGTAETQIGTAINNVWFIAFAPAANPKVAIAVTLKGVPGFGAAFAAPIAREVIERLLHD